jgi:phosphatidylglycerophosphate synthase
MESTEPSRAAAPPGWILAVPDADALRVWGISPAERLRRGLALAGVDPVTIVAADGEAPPVPEQGVVVVRADWVLDERILERLREAREPVWVEDGEEGVAVAARVAGPAAPDWLAALRSGEAGALPGDARTTPGALVPSYISKLRKSQPPWCLQARPDRIDTIERHTFGASYKGATDLVTKWVWPAPARWLTGVLARARVRPNTVTAISWVLAVLTVWLFMEGAFATGLVCAWLMTFLDTVDGKLARVTLTSSKLGDFLDHGLDLVHPPVWWWAWGVGIGAATSPEVLIVVVGYFVGRLLEGVFLASFKMETHSWRPIDTLFRTITARRNPNLILLSVGAVAGRPDLGMAMLALWTVASLSFHAVRLLQALLARQQGREVEPWDQPSGSDLAESGTGSRG